MNITQIIFAYIISNLVAIAFFITSLKWKHIAQGLFAALFILAAITNWSMAYSNPAVYLDYSKYAVSMYRDIILGPFSGNITSVVSFIAVSQLLIGVGLLFKGIVLRASCIAGSIFLIAISPLGIASAFPSGLIFCAGLFVLYKYSFQTQISKSKFFVKPFQHSEMSH